VQVASLVPSPPPRRRAARWRPPWGALLPLLPLLLLGAACETSPRDLRRPSLVALSEDGQIHVADFHHHRIVSFDAAGHFLRELGSRGLGEGQLWQPWALLAPAPGELLVVQERPRSLKDATTVWELKHFREGSEVARHDLAPPGTEGPRWMEGLALAPGGGYWFTDQQRGVVLRFDAQWQFLGSWSAPVGGGEPFASPGVLLREGEEVWLVETFAHRVRRLDAAGRELVAFGEEGSQPGQLRFPQSLGVCPGQWVAVADLGNRRVQRFDRSGRYLDGFRPQPAAAELPLQLVDVKVSADCQRLFLVDSKGGRLLITRPDGEVLQVVNRW